MSHALALKKDHPLLRFPIATVGLLACLAMLFVSATMNFRFGFGLATNPEDGWLYGMLSASADVLKVVVPFVVLWAARERMRWVWRVAVGVLCVSALYGWAGAAGHFSKNRLETAGQHTLEADSYKDLRADKARAEDAIKWLPPHRSGDAVKADMQGLKSKTEWHRSGGCDESQIAGKGQREFCQQFFKLNAELGNAVAHGQHQARIDEIAAKLGKVKGAAASGAEDGDAQATTLSKLTFGYVGVAKMQIMLVLIGIACLELGGGFGPFCFFAYAFGISLHAIVLKDDEKEESPANATAANAGQSGPRGGGILVAEAKPMLALPPPVEESKPIATVPAPSALPEPAAEWRPLLAELDYFTARKGALRKPIDRKVLGYHWLTWLYAYGRVGTFTSEQVERMFEEFLLASWREAGTGVNIAKGELHASALKLDKGAITRDKKSNWTITLKSPKRMRELLVKRAILRPTPAVAAQPDTKTTTAAQNSGEATRGTVVPFPTSPEAAASGDVSLAAVPANENTKPRRPVRGLAELTRQVPDLDAQRHWSRMEKTAWKARRSSLRPQHMHRFSRARAA